MTTYAEVSLPGIGPSLSAPAALDEALDAVFSLGVCAMKARRCSLYLHAGGDGTQLRLHRARGVGATPEEYIPSSGAVAGLVMQSRVGLLVRDESDYPGLPLHPERYATPSFVAVPILVENNAVGVFNAADRDDGAAFDHDDLAAAEAVARSVSAVLYNDCLIHRLLDDADTDPVTGLSSRSRFERRLHHEAMKARRFNHPLSLLLLSVENYADVATHAGPQTAGMLMQRVGAIVAQMARPSDVVARATSACIAVLLANTPLSSAREVAHALTREVTHDQLPASLRYECESLSIAIGLAALAPRGKAADLLSRATKALRTARTHGDATVIADEDNVVMLPDPALDDIAIRDVLSNGLHAGIPYLDDPLPAATPEALTMLSSALARQHRVVPIAFEGGTLTLAMANPLDGAAIRAVSMCTRMAVSPVVSPPTAIDAAIDALYP